MSDPDHDVAATLGRQQARWRAGRSRSGNPWDPVSIVRRRLAQQRLTAERFNGPADVVAWLGVVQAQEYAEAKWSLAERTLNCTDAVIEASFARGEPLRTHVLRPTWHFVTPVDIRWMLRLTRPRVHALNRYSYTRFGLGAPLLSRADDLLARALEDGEPRTRPELAEWLRGAGVEADGLRLGYLLMHAELEEVVCSGPRRGRQQTYALLDHRAPPSASDDLPRERAVDELVRRYFFSHGPATVKDFTARSSLTTSDARAGLERVGAQLERSDRPDGTVWYAAPSPVSPPSGNAAYLIPRYDETIVAYRDLRVALVHSSPFPALLDRPIVVNGRTVGSWRRTLSKHAAQVEATLFGSLGKREAEALDAVTERFGRFLGMQTFLQTRAAT